MKITYFQGREPNFGDHLNPWLWPKLIPDFFDDDEKTVFLGIGSILGERPYKDDVRKIVFGTGFVPEYHQRPCLSHSNWDIYFVRGPRTAKALNLSNDLALGDSAILLRTILDPWPRPSTQVVSFMPHWESIPRGNWAEACRMANINLIDPRLPVETILHELKRSKMVIAEAMHGAIIADALRIPWIPVQPLNYKHRGKWLDWADSLGIKLQRHSLWPSSLQEVRLSVLRKPITDSPISALIQKSLIRSAAYGLARLASASPQLSADRVIDRVTDAMLDKVALLKRNFR
jgi:succinoglycan biosynthesis protein ExoV